MVWGLYLFKFFTDLLIFFFSSYNWPSSRVREKRVDLHLVASLNCCDDCRVNSKPSWTCIVDSY